MSDRGLARFVPNGNGARSAAPATTAVGNADEAAGVLARIARQRPPVAPGEACEFCGEPVPEHDHRHVVDLERRGLLCSCRGCALLFTEAGAAQGRYRSVPERYLRVEPFTLPPQVWASLQIPVGIAFVVHNTQLQQTVAFYPSPGGATESELPLEAWGDIVAANPGLEQVEPDVEAALVRTESDGAQCLIVPVDRCYELVGTLRLYWRGFDGGQEVRAHLEEFFADVTRRSRPMRLAGPPTSP
jgi:Family of unknown function (DUF5947)